MSWEDEDYENSTFEDEEDTQTVYLAGKGLKTLFGFNFSNKKIIDCSCNKLTDIMDIILSKNLESFRCHENILSSLPQFPISLTILSCSNNKLTSLNVEYLFNLKIIYCADNPITEIKFTDSLEQLEITRTKINKLDKLPKKKLWCDDYLLIVNHQTGDLIVNDHKHYSGLVMLAMMKKLEITYNDVLNMYNNKLYGLGGEKYNESQDKINRLK